MAELGSETHSKDNRGFGVASPGAPRPRPRQAKTAAVLLVIFGVLTLAVTSLLLSVVNDQSDHGEAVNPFVYGLAYGQFVFSVAQVTSGLFVWQGRAWARTLAVVLCSVNILGGVVSLISGNVVQAIVSIALNGGLISILNGDNVR